MNTWLTLICFLYVAISSINVRRSTAAEDEYAPNTCSDFFTVVAEKMPWRSRISDTCQASFSKMYSRLMVLSAQMVKMNATLTVYTTYEDLQRDCGIIKNPPHVEIVYFEAVDILEDYGYTSALRIMQTWDVRGYTRASDILRIPLQHRFGKVYLDTDMHLLDMSKENYYKPFVGAAIARDFERNVEISNSAFCLSKSALWRMMQFQQDRIMRGLEFGHSEFGAEMFSRVLINEHPLMLYSQNPPKLRNLSELIETMQVYHHKFVHLTANFRKGYPSWIPLIDNFRSLAHLPNLKVRPAEDYFKYASGNPENIQPLQPPPPPPPLKKKEESSDAVGFGDGNVIWPFSNLEVAPGAR